MATLLIVEDEPFNAELAELVCRAAGHDVHLAQNGLEALALLEDHAFDLVLTDVKMPRMDGVTMTREIRASQAPYRDVPILGMTAKAGQEDLAGMIAAGMLGVITKPFRSGTLRAWVDRALGAHATRRSA